jgi:hypothetical protein
MGIANGGVRVMRGAWDQLLGKTIKAVITADNPGDPRMQVFFVFSDGTSFEMFGEDVQGASWVVSGGFDAAVQYAKGFGGIVQIFREAATGLDVDSGGEGD